MEKVTDSLSFIKHNRGKFALKSDKALTEQIDSALSLVYKEGFTGASVLKDDKTSAVAKSKKKQPLADKWLLPSLVMDNMECEQIWQQLELWNRRALPSSIQLSSWTLANGLGKSAVKSREQEDESMAESSSDSDNSEEYQEIGESEGDSKKASKDLDDWEEIGSQGAEVEEDDKGEDDEDEDADEDEDTDKEDEREGNDESSENNDKSVKKDNFFNMSEMDKFADEPVADEADEMIYSEFVAQVDNEADNNAKYSDFFDPPAKKAKQSEKKVVIDPNDISTLERRQAIEKRSREKFEEENLAPKPWVLSGEVDSKERPQNSLLEHHVEFDHATRLAPIVTEEFSKSIEEIIRQRIIDKAWDDVERKVKPVADSSEFRRRAMLDSEKPKMSLAELYEKDYVDKQKGQMALGQNEHGDEKVEAIKVEMRDLFFKLDALSHFQFNPKPPAPELRIVKNLPSATLEEAAPVTVTDANLLAPAEVKRPISGELKSKEEQTDTDRKRARRRAKAHMRAKQKTKMERLVTKAAAGDTKASKLLALEKLKTGSRVKVVNEEINKKKKPKKGSKDKKPKGQESTVSGVKSSAEFFARLQDAVDSQADQRSEKKQKRRSR